MILCGHAKGYSPERAAEWYTGTQKLRDLLEGLAPVTPPVALQYFHHLAGILPPREAHGLIEELSCFHNEYPGEFTLILSGSPVIPGDDTVAETVEKAGGSLIPANCTGLQGFPRGEPRDYTPGSLAALHLRSSSASQEQTSVFEYIGETASGFSAHGILVKCLSFCDLWFTEKVRLKERYSLPVLVMDSGLKQAKGRGWQ